MSKREELKRFIETATDEQLNALIDGLNESNHDHAYDGLIMRLSEVVMIQ